MASPNNWSKYIGEHPEQQSQLGTPPSYPYPIPAYQMPQPPKKNTAVTAIVSLLGVVALAAGGYFAYEHFIANTDSASAASSSSPTSSASPETDPRPVNGAASPPKPKLGEGFSSREQQYIDRLGDTGVVVHTPALAVHDGHDACNAASESGSVLDAVKLMQKYNADMGEIGAIITTVVAVQTFCPQNSNLGTSTTTGNPLPPGVDGEFINRLQDVGLSVDNQSDAIGDGHKVCTTMEQAPSDKFLSAAQMLVDANPRIGKPAAIFMAVIAIQVYCPPRE